MTTPADAEALARKFTRFPVFRKSYACREADPPDGFLSMCVVGSWRGAGAGATAVNMASQSKGSTAEVAGAAAVVGTAGQASRLGPSSPTCRGTVGTPM